jgi:hypothetical protein
MRYIRITMKIVQSLWSKPAQVVMRQGEIPRHACGWADKKYNYLSWILSVHQFKRFYEEVELVTDACGYELLINKLELPYSRVQVVLDELNNYPASLWAIGKIFAYSLQKEPFIHADGDVFIWARFEERLERSALLCQCREEGEFYNRPYWKMLLTLAQNFDYYPLFFNKGLGINRSIKSINAGIFGGSDTPFIRKYCEAAFDFVNRNLKNLHKIECNFFNAIFEQFLFRALCEDQKRELNYLNPAVSLSRSHFTEYTGIPAKIRYMHPFGIFKRNSYVAEWLEYKVLTDYPDQYYMLIRLLKANEI